LIRVNPGVEVHTHEFIQTGQEDSKFGVSLQNDAFEVITLAQSMKNIEFLGLHCHIGSQIFETEGYTVAISRIAEFVHQINLEIKELNLGGGFGIRYTLKDNPLPIEKFVETIANTVVKIFGEYELDLPKLILEPGRAIVGDSGITAYTVGAIKEIPNVRKYISVDGSMADNPRHALYGSEYEVLNISGPCKQPQETVTIVGKACESGDIIAKDVQLPRVEPAEWIVVECTGAYNYSMASNYNRLPRPAVVIVSKGKDRVLVKRENYEDLVILDK